MLQDRAAIVGIGQTRFAKRLEASGAPLRVVFDRVADELTLPRWLPA